MVSNVGQYFSKVMIKKPDCSGPFDASVYLEHLKKTNDNYKALLV